MLSSLAGTSRSYLGVACLAKEGPADVPFKILDEEETFWPGLSRGIAADGYSSSSSVTAGSHAKCSALIFLVSFLWR